jgi:rhodanese-related sulfurtransferase
MTKGYKQMLAEADALVSSVSCKEMATQLGSYQFVFVDIRDPRELEREGMIPNAFSAPRGMLEFWIDVESPYHKPLFAEGKTYIFYCASGWRSLLAARLAMEMGIDTRSLRGGFEDWKRAGYPVAQKSTSRELERSG